MFTSVATVLGTILSEHKKMSKHKKGALYHPYDWNFDWLYAVSGLQCQGLQLWTYNGCQLLMKVSHESKIQGCVCKGRLWVLHSSFTLQPSCCEIAQLAGWILKAKAGQSACCLSSFFQWLMMSSSVCPFKFAKVKEMGHVQRQQHWWCFVILWLPWKLLEMEEYVGKN